jgi:hypothetical protein
VFVPATPIAAASGAHARLTLAFDGGAVGQALGCFRVGDGNVDTAEGVSVRAKTRALLAVPGANRSEDDQKRIRTEYRAAAESLKGTRDRIEAINKELEQLGIVSALVMSERPNFDRPATFFHERGAYLSPGERVYAATPGVLPPMAEDQMPNRLGLARWLVSPANPLTARVTVNRAWEHSSAGASSRRARTSERRARRHRIQSCSTGRDRVRSAEVEREGAAPADRDSAAYAARTRAQRA